MSTNSTEDYDCSSESTCLLKAELEIALRRISEIEEKLEELDMQIPKKYADVPRLNYLRKKRILVTGGAGFVGSHLVDALMLQGHEVIVVDNFFTGRKQNIAHWIGHENFDLIRHDVINPLFVEVDQIYHLACPASPPHYMQDSVKTIKVNTLGTINMLELAQRVNATILLASTSEVYGDPEEHPQSETYWGNVNPIGPRACYNEGKRAAESLAHVYSQRNNLNIRIARIFNTFGPRMHINDGRVASNFIVQALQERSLTVYGTGNQTRSFMYVSDLVEGLIALMESSYSSPVNIGNPIEFTINEFASIIRQLVGGGSQIDHVEEPQDDPRKRKPDITRARRCLKWEPKVSLIVGLQKTIDYFKREVKMFNLQLSKSANCTSL
ncbi:UDP-glucuronic acid decarboxylase 1-like [Photinus pyralis]|uniref:UDP-glucuronic acid decarboxylase 1-like n=1 Tax=Photinus pyralis TaxID=7054 RepID=UPI00126708E4|nr:UDP-glucuronic acid decarboxylase 1-like [Photinus pyralis]